MIELIHNVDYFLIYLVRMMKLTLGWKWWIKVRFTTLFCIFHYAIILLIYNCLRDSHLVFNKLKCFRRIMILKVSMKLINSSLSFRLDVYIPYLPVKLDYVTAFHKTLRIAISSHYYNVRFWNSSSWLLSNMGGS